MTMRVTRAEFLGLEPCPHCGGEAEFDWIMGVPSLRVIRCKCGAMITMGNVTDAFDGELAELWNTRAERTCELEDMDALVMTLSMPELTEWKMCSECGYATPSWSKYCNNCGAKVVKE